MAESQKVSIAIVCEADADRRIVTDLIDRVIGEHGIGTDRNLESCRMWWQPPGGNSFLAVKRVPTLARAINLKVWGHFPDGPGASYAHAARLAFLYLKKSSPRPNAVAYVVDPDNDIDRHHGCEQARSDPSLPFKVAIGLAHPKRECWVLAAFHPSNDAEAGKLAELQKQLGFNPTTHSHRLTAKHDNDKKSAKRVLRELVEDESACWQAADLNKLKQRGLENGLNDFVGEVSAQIIPLFETGLK